jgi:hypothetical protein
MCFGVVILSFVFPWAAQLYAIHFKVPASMFPPRLIAVQIFLFIGWTAIGALGGYVGGLIRSRRSGGSSVAGRNVPDAPATN